MIKRKTTTTTEEFDKNGKVTKRVTTTVEEEGIAADFGKLYPAPPNPQDPPPPTWPSSYTPPYDPWWAHPITSEPIVNPQINWVASEPSTETYSGRYQAHVRPSSC